MRYYRDCGGQWCEAFCLILITPLRLVEIGEALFGRRWRTPLARLIGRDPSMIWYYTRPRDPTPIPTEAAALLAAELTARALYMDDLAKSVHG
jgi:hypothetical protein